jgi:hypothetical protein
MLKRYDNFFTKEECNSLLDDVNQNSDHWKINPLTEYRTLGNCLFSAMVRLGTDNTNNYSIETTIDLKIYKLFKEKLGKLFTNIEFTTNFGKPGYTIILPNQPKSALWHYDNELPLFPYEKEFEDYNKNFHAYFEKSYTFVIMLSKGEYSFDYYPETVSKYKNTVEEEMNNYICKDHIKLVGDICSNKNCQLKKYERINYNQGTLLIQEERFLHRASPAEFNSDKDIRIIARGYGVMKNNVLYIFW